jgi:hypothetical protein
MIFLCAQPSRPKRLFLKLLEENVSAAAKILSIKNGSACLDSFAAQLDLCPPGTEAGDRFPGTLKSLQEQINTGKRFVLLCEDADQFSDSDFERIRQFSNMHTGSGGYLSVLLCGSHALLGRMGFGHLRGLQQRIAHHFDLPDLPPVDISENTQIQKQPFPLLLPRFRTGLALAAASALAFIFLATRSPPSNDKAPLRSSEIPRDLHKETYEFIFQTEEQALSAIHGREDPSSNPAGHGQSGTETR